MILARATALLRMPTTADSSIENSTFEFGAYFAFSHNMPRLCLDFGSPHQI